MTTARQQAEFVAEANETVEAFTIELSAVVEGAQEDPDKLNALFRAAHSLKGVAGLFGYEKMARLAHHAEDALDALRLGKIQLTTELATLLFSASDSFSTQLAQIASGLETEEAQQTAHSIGLRLGALAAGTTNAQEDLLDSVGLDPKLRAVFTEYEEHRLRENVKKGVGLYKVRVSYSLDDFDSRLANLNAVLKPMGEVISTLPSSEPGDESSIAFDLIFGCKESIESVKKAASDAMVTKLLRDVMLMPPPISRPPIQAAPPSSAPQPPPSAPVWNDEGSSRLTPLPQLHSGISSPSDASLKSLSNTVRVDISRLDGLMNSIGELLLVRQNLERLAESATQSSTHLPRLWAQELTREARNLERRLDELQKGILEVRMVPLGQVFDKLARLMRRLCRESGKDVLFDISGGDVELDKLIVEELSDPIMHLLRNALDHGVETPRARVANGKKEQATIVLRASQRGNHVLIEVGDDGNGMDESRIRQVAIERHLVTPEQTEEMDRRELLNLVFLPGFSTRQSVSELSGRGVGLDVVKTNLARLSGLIDIQSRTGKGTTFTLTLPPTLAILRALMVRVSDHIYAVPLNSVLEVVELKTASLGTIERREVFELRGHTLPFIRLSNVFNLPAVERPTLFVVVVGIAQQRVGLAVDSLIGQQDIVTKPLKGRLARVKGFSGATELGDRRAVLVLDIAQLVEDVFRAQPLAS
jgi:two-component system, chemotaxis family, sensor kinase CheA